MTSRLKVVLLFCLVTLLLLWPAGPSETAAQRGTLKGPAAGELSTFYFAEGTTRPNFVEYLCIGNPNAAAAAADVTYLFSDGTTMGRTYTVPANSRFTVNVNSEVGAGKDVSIKLISHKANLVAERPVYFNYNSAWTGGSNAVGSASPNKSWYFAEGTTLDNFDQYVTVLNPESTRANLTFHYMVEGAGEKDVTRSVGPNTRATFRTNDDLGPNKNDSLYLSSNVPVIAERPMYFNYHGVWTGGHDVLGANSPNAKWYFAEGTTRHNSTDGAFDEWLCLQNPGTSPATVDVVYQPAQGQGGGLTKTYTVPPRQRLTVYVNNDIGPNKDCSIALTSNLPVIAERPMYFNYHNIWTGGHDVLGTNGSGTNWFFAEGTTRADFDEWLCLQNPGAADAHATITYYPATGTKITKAYTVKAFTRLTVSANTDVGPNEDISATITADHPIIAERPMYFNYKSAWTGGSDVVGFQKRTVPFLFVMGTRYFKAPMTPEPQKAVAFQDPCFHTTLERVTEKADGYIGPGIQNEYAKMDPENCDGTLLILRGNSAAYYLYHTRTCKLLRQIKAFDKCNYEEPEPRWDRTNPDLFYYLCNTQLRSYDVKTGSSKTIHDFHHEFPSAAVITTKQEGDASLGRRYWCLMVEDSNYNLLSVICYDKSLNRIVGKKSGGFPDRLDWVGMSMSGRYCLVGYQDTAIYTDVFSRNFTKRTSLPEGSAGHGDAALTVDGRDVYVYQNVRTDYISLASMSSGIEISLLKIPFEVNIDIGMHVSGNCAATPGWVLVSTYGSKNPPSGMTHSWMDAQLFMLELKKNPRVWRIAHTQSYTSRNYTGLKNYFAEAYAAINTSGTRIYWGSNWRRFTNDYSDAYEAILPVDWVDRMPK